jgi:hypothetical protein
MVAARGWGKAFAMMLKALYCGERVTGEEMLDVVEWKYGINARRFVRFGSPS